jgi:ABC-2 type transport system permease protein
VSGVVRPLAAGRLAYGVVLRQLITRGRVAALALVGIVVTAVAVAVGASATAADTAADRTERGVRLISDLGFTTLAPIVALVFASAALGDLREDATLVYLWLRPMDRWPVVVGAWLAAVTVSVPLVLVPLVASSIVVDAGNGLVGATVLAGFVAVIAYSAVFVLAGLLLKNAIVWGLGYVLIWEGIVAAFGSFAAKLAIRGYTRSILTAITDVDLDLGDIGLVAAVTIPVVAAGVALALAGLRLRSMDVA